MSEKKLLRLRDGLWSRCKAAAYRRRMGVWEWVEAVLEAVVLAEEGKGRPRVRRVPVEEKVGELVEELFSELPPVVREARKRESSVLDSDQMPRESEGA